MEFHEKLQELRKNRNLTQAELAELLYVSRTAISKWESGRGYPSIDSLKAIAQFFSVTIDELLSGEAVLSIAEEEQKQTEKHYQSLVFGLLDCSASLLLFLPFFAQKSDGIIQAVSLLNLTQAQPYLKIAYFAAVIGTVVLGVAALALQTCTNAFWVQHKNQLSIICSMVAVLLFVISQQPYPAVFSLVFLIIKAWMLIKRG